MCGEHGSAVPGSGSQNGELALAHPPQSAFLGPNAYSNTSGLTHASGVFPLTTLTTLRVASARIA